MVFESYPYCRLSPPRRKNPGKAPKKIHKAEREKLKRDHLNVLFLELGNALGNFLYLYGTLMMASFFFSPKLISRV